MKLRLADLWLLYLCCCLQQLVLAVFIGWVFLRVPMSIQYVLKKVGAYY
jgi:hypothetical protein